jgi:ABC-type Mn2+/Zn2+ transport system permease subunit
MPLPTVSTRRHDPFWDLDGSAARRSRSQRKFLRVGLVVLGILFVAFVAVRLPAFDPQLLTTSGNLRPVLAIALFALLASCALVAAVRIRGTSEES